MTWFQMVEGHGYFFRLAHQKFDQITEPVVIKDQNYMLYIQTFDLLLS